MVATTNTWTSSAITTICKVRYEKVSTSIHRHLHSTDTFTPQTPSPHRNFYLPQTLSPHRQLYPRQNTSTTVYLHRLSTTVPTADEPIPSQNYPDLCPAVPLFIGVRCTFTSLTHSLLQCKIFPRALNRYRELSLPPIEAQASSGPPFFVPAPVAPLEAAFLEAAFK